MTRLKYIKETYVDDRKNSNYRGNMRLRKREHYIYILDQANICIETGIKPGKNFQIVKQATPGRVYMALSGTGLLQINKGYSWDGCSGPCEETAANLFATLVHDALYQLMRLADHAGLKNMGTNKRYNNERWGRYNFRDDVDRFFRKLWKDNGGCLHWLAWGGLRFNLVASNTRKEAIQDERKPPLPLVSSVKDELPATTNGSIPCKGNLGPGGVNVNGWVTFRSPPQ